MKKYWIKRIFKYGVLGLVLVWATIFIYDHGRKSYEDYVNRHENDIEWIEENIQFVEDYKIGDNIFVVEMPDTLDISHDLYREVVQKKIDQLLIDNYRISSPLILYDPFLEDEGSVNIYFYTGEKYKFEYYVTTDSIATDEDLIYQRMLDADGNDSLVTKHYYTLTGFVPGKRNNLLIRILDQNDEIVQSENFILNIPES